jgi:hypothetical protein
MNIEPTEGFFREVYKVANEKAAEQGGVLRAGHVLAAVRQIIPQNPIAKVSDIVLFESLIQTISTLKDSQLKKNDVHAIVTALKRWENLTETSTQTKASVRRIAGKFFRVPPLPSSRVVSKAVQKEREIEWKSYHDSAVISTFSELVERHRTQKPLSPVLDTFIRRFPLSLQPIALCKLLSMIEGQIEHAKFVMLSAKEKEDFKDIAAKVLRKMVERFGEDLSKLDEVSQENVKTVIGHLLIEGKLPQALPIS